MLILEDVIEGRYEVTDLDAFSGRNRKNSATVLPRKQLSEYYLNSSAKSH